MKTIKIEQTVMKILTISLIIGASAILLIVFGA